MAQSSDAIIIPLSINGQLFNLMIRGQKPNYLVAYNAEAIEHGEAPYQIYEGSYYEYQMEGNYYLRCPGFDEIVTRSHFKPSMGRIAPNIYVGTLELEVLDQTTDQVVTKFSLEVQSDKLNYRDDYRQMLSDITEKCVDLLLQHDSPVEQTITKDFTSDAQTLYQRFAFIKSVINSPEFNDSIQKILNSPVTRWKDTECVKDIRNIRRMNSGAIRQIAGNSNRMPLPVAHPLANTLDSIPIHITTTNKTESIDTPENSFIKFALDSFLNLLLIFKSSLNSERVSKEANLIIDKLEQYLQHSMFKEVSTLKTLPLNSPVLQRKEGYREVLRVWLMLDLASKLIWHGGDDVYKGNKKDIAILYEYWVFFKLLDIVKYVFKLDTYVPQKLLRETDNGIDLILKQGNILPIEGLYISNIRNLRVTFHYNKNYRIAEKYPDGGSWTRYLRPDYSISIWPEGIDAETAEREELIVHIHFDAKYKLESIADIFGKNDTEGSKNEEDEKAELLQEKDEQRRGTYKRVDLLKMHTYKDAIRRTAGAYVLYPGTEKPFTRSGFHEIIPGLGAFPLRPSKTNDGSKAIEQFLYAVLEHFLNRTSQREKLATKVYQIHKDDPIITREYLPEAIGTNRDFIPDETTVIIGYVKNQAHYDWITSKGLYNFRTNEDKGALVLNKDFINARYLLLYRKGATTSGDMWEIKSKGPRLVTKKQLNKSGYPGAKHDYYLVIDIEKVDESIFNRRVFNVAKMKNYKKGGEAFAEKLMEVVVKYC